jgi:hypothetical protein
MEVNMKKGVLLVVCFIWLTLHVFAQKQVAFSNEIMVTYKPTYAEQIEATVKAKLTEWLQKDPMEKLEEYQVRVDKQNKQRKVDEFTQIVIASIAEKVIDWSKIDAVYDSENETYKITVANMLPFLIKVPHGEQAQSFQDNLHELIFNDIKYTLQGEEFAVTDLVIKDPFLDTEYQLDRSVQNHFVTALDINIGNIDINLSSNVQKINERVKVISVGNSDVDINLPVTKSKNENAYAVVIGNKDYKNIKGKDVDFAINDAVMIKKYLVDVMGFMPGNVIYRENAAKGDFEAIFGTRENYKAELYELVKNPNAEVFIYYSGHGAPSQYDKKSYLVPVECKPNNVQFGGYPTELLYGNLAKIRTKFTTVIIDACYSGNIYENISPLGIPVEETKVELPNGAVITATSSNETANWYPEQQHGMFTYFFLKALQNPQKTDKNTDNKVTLDEVYDFVNDHNAGVPYQARLIGQQQNPNIKGNAKDKIVIEY